MEREALRHTPAGVPIVRFRVAHESTQSEGGVARKVGCEVRVVAAETEARLLAGAPLGSDLRIAGFLDRQGKTGKQLVLHATRIEFISDN